ncbi:hypothetical protein [Hymenobacter mucosus]|uniref:Uncharacterized protein n=1 Tax=Hymenobacter mucosus TaxID=1411120 RepID=A0A239A8I5_9BACT|nr:hypothetical protein [Hymenobacter mucosus]SNR91927.1 hypothetical protein SAMN06269173_11162 [Hymenobacter mucosus]
MKKRLRKKLGQGEFRSPSRHTKRELEANAQVFACISALIENVGEDKFISWIETHNEAI